MERNKIEIAVGFTGGIIKITKKTKDGIYGKACALKPHEVNVWHSSAKQAGGRRVKESWTYFFSNETLASAAEAVVAD